MRIVVSGGGSGGHITPLLAIAHHLQSRDNRLYYIGTGDAMEQRLLAGSNIAQYRISAGKWRRYRQRRWRAAADIKTWLLNIRDFFRFLLGLIQSLWLLTRLRPDRVFVKGGYVGLPVGIAAVILRIPCIIHESDSIPGLTNRILARMTSYRLSGFDLQGFLNLGNPVREEIIKPGPNNRSHFGIVSRKPIVLVTGGSLGSHRINQVVVDLVEHYDDFEIIHIYGRFPLNTPDFRSYYHPYEFLTGDMPHALQLADIVIARAGANTLAELAVLAKPSVIIPHPGLKDQLANTEACRDSIAVIDQKKLTSEKLHRVLCKLIENSAERNRLRRASAVRGRPQAAAEIANYILTLHKRDSYAK